MNKQGQRVIGESLLRGVERGAQDSLRIQAQKAAERLDREKYYQTRSDRMGRYAVEDADRERDAANQASEREDKWRRMLRNDAERSLSGDRDYDLRKNAQDFNQDATAARITLEDDAIRGRRERDAASAALNADLGARRAANEKERINIAWKNANTSRKAVEDRNRSTGTTDAEYKKAVAVLRAVQGMPQYKIRADALKDSLKSLSDAEQMMASFGGSGEELGQIRAARDAAMARVQQLNEELVAGLPEDVRRPLGIGGDAATPGVPSAGPAAAPEEGPGPSPFDAALKRSGLDRDTFFQQMSNRARTDGDTGLAEELEKWHAGAGPDEPGPPQAAQDLLHDDLDKLDDVVRRSKKSKRAAVRPFIAPPRPMW